jgi:acyl-CoA thioester hydrolase
MYLKEFEIRWSDLDANRHVANSSYADMLSETRMSFLHENGITQARFEELGIGPVIFTEEFYYIKEIKANESIRISIELLASSPHYKFVKFAHCIFNKEHTLSVYSETLFGWLNLMERRLIIPPAEIIATCSSLPKADNYTSLDENMSLKNPKIPFGKSI